MKYILDTEVLKQNNISLAEFGLLLFFMDGKTTVDIDSLCHNLWANNDYLIKVTGGYVFNSFKFDALQEILAQGSLPKTVNQRADYLAPKLRELYPSGFKEVFVGGVKKKYPWKDSDRIIANRLRVFFKRYGDNYSNEDIIDATKRYTQGFKNSDTSYMQLLKYFIFKDAKAIDGTGEHYIDETSTLLSYLQNKEESKSVIDIGELI